MSDPSYVVETLAWCNEVRGVRGMEPLEQLPLGKRRDPRSCPCGVATGLRVRSAFADDPSDPTGRIMLPGAVRMFVDMFDRGYLPQYDEWRLR